MVVEDGSEGGAVLVEATLAVEAVVAGVVDVSLEDPPPHPPNAKAVAAPIQASAITRAINLPDTVTTSLSRGTKHQHDNPSGLGARGKRIALRTHQPVFYLDAPS